MTAVEDAYRRYDVAKMVLAVLSVVLILAALLLLTLNTIRADDQRDLLVRQGALLVECTTAPALREPPVKNPKPTDCWVRSQAASGQIIGEPAGPINTVTVLSVACGRVPANDTPMKILACVEKELASR